ncbi:unnamed protein product [Penicillium salamii]|uniref:Uncharacterized protein n=1 Tax=Penicillium salamii TaxID=1612424 RepID=A0A9W4NUI0_9EURO|nr:unnamed protein product [Penicillium salamii]CAG8380892.1 unnamed protein product [Penicillium salamii]CAG8412508.1 unnamed protein product [Penicillium salamii]CAG8413004.1 unnamed protein product [Penicillium salamii]
MPNGPSRKWPTLVGEVTCSERRTKPQEEINFWMSDPRVSVNIAITISVLRDKIMVQSWKGNHTWKLPATLIQAALVSMAS